MDKIQIQCDRCSVRLAVPESAIGKKIRCPKCEGVILVAVNDTNGGPNPKQTPEPTIPVNPQKPKAASSGVSKHERSRTERPTKQAKQAPPSRETAEVNSPHFSNRQRTPNGNSSWSYQIMGKVFSNVGCSDLLQQFETGRLDVDTLVRRDGTEDWRRIEDCIAELKSALPIPIEPIPRDPVSVREPRNSTTVEQLDNTLFLVEGLPQEEVFRRLKNAAGKNHSITGAFSRSGLIRGTGASGISFVITVQQTDEGVTFLLDGETPQGPANFGAIFDPTSGQGWGLLAATALFNSTVNSSAAKNVETDLRTLLMNLLTAFDAEHLLLGDTSGSPPIETTSTPPQLLMSPANAQNQSAPAKDQIITTLPLAKVVVLIMNVLQQPVSSSPMLERITGFFSFKGELRYKDVQWNGHAITAQVGKSNNHAWVYNLVIPVTGRANGTCAAQVTLEKIHLIPLLDFGQKRRTLQAIDGAIRQAIIEMEKER